MDWLLYTTRRNTTPCVVRSPILIQTHTTRYTTATNSIPFIDNMREISMNADYAQVTYEQRIVFTLLHYVLTSRESIVYNFYPNSALRITRKFGPISSEYSH